MAEIKISTSGLNSARTLSELTKKGIRVRNAIRDGNTLVFSISSKQKELTKSVLKSLRLDSEDTKIVRFWDKLISPWRFGLIVGVVICTIAYLLCSSIILRVDVNGLKASNARDIVEFLEENGINIGTSKKLVDCEKIESALYNRFDFSVVECKTLGTSLLITVKEELDAPMYNDLVEPKNLIADEDALITRIVCAQGTKAIDVGKSVKKGAMLISAYKYIGDAQIPICAVGEVYGRVWREKEIYVSDQKTTYKPTGRTESAFVMRIGEIPTEIPPSSFKYYTITKSTVRIGDFLPFYRDTYVFSEQVGVVVERDEKERVSLIEKAKKEIILENADGNGEFVRSWTLEKKVDGGMLIKVIAEFEKRIDIYA